MAESPVTFGIRFPPAQPYDDVAAAARLAEEAGFDFVWAVDSPLVAGNLFDPYVDLVAVARATRRVCLGPAVSNIYQRHPLTTAGAMLSLDRIAPGRTALGLGTGGSSLVTLGMAQGHAGAFAGGGAGSGARQRLEDLRQAVLLLRRLFRGEAIRPGQRELRLTAPRHVPIYLAAAGPRALALAGEVADGVIMQVGTNPVTVRHSISHVARGAARAGRRLEEVELVLSTFAVVSDDRADDVRRVRPLASFFYSVTPHLLDLAGVRYQRRFPERMPHPDLTHAYDWDEAMAAAATYISDEAVDQFCLVGPPERAIERLRALASLGIRQFFLRWSSTYDLPTPLVHTFGARIIPALARP